MNFCKFLRYINFVRREKFLKDRLRWFYLPQTKNLLETLTENVQWYFIILNSSKNMNSDKINTSCANSYLIKSNNILQFRVSFRRAILYGMQKWIRFVVLIEYTYPPWIRSSGFIWDYSDLVWSVKGRKRTKH